MKNKKIIILIILILISILTLIGSSYALLTKTFTSKKLSVEVGTLKVDFTEGNAINLDNTKPMSDSDGLNTTPYTFTITNSGTIDSYYTISNEEDTNNTLDTTYLKYKLVSNDGYDSGVKRLKDMGTGTYRIVDERALLKSKSVTYKLYLWVASDAGNDIQNKIYKSKIIVNSISNRVGDTYCIDNGFTKLSDCMLVMNKHEDTTDIAKTNIKAKGTPDFSKTATTDEGLFMAEDDEGESYYYRGAVKNNYVSFAGFIWRIIRRNGDGSVRMIYSGKKTSDKGEAATIGKSQFNSKYWDPTYVGYKYNENFVLHLDNKQVSNSGFVNTITYNFGTEYTFNQETKKFYLSGEIKPLMWKSNYNDIVSKYKYTCFSSECNIIYKVTGYVNDNVVSIQPINYGSKNYEDTLLNSTNSTIENTINTWYKKNLIKYSNYLFDTVFCNDRSISSGTGFKVDEQTNYAAWHRIYNNSPSLKCLQTTDKFKVSNTNAKLDYPIALLTADELVLAGGKSYKDSIYHDNKNFYLYIGDLAYFLLTPSYFDSTYSSRALVFGLTAEGTLHPGHNISYRFGVRPVINLKPDITISSGDGTADAPYKIN